MWGVEPGGTVMEVWTLGRLDFRSDVRSDVRLDVCSEGPLCSIEIVPFGSAAQKSNDQTIGAPLPIHSI